MNVNDLSRDVWSLLKASRRQALSYAAPLLVAATALLYSVGGEVYDSGMVLTAVVNNTPSSPSAPANHVLASITEDLNHNALTLLYGCTNPAACNFDFYTDCIDLSQLQNDWGGPCEYLDDGSCVFPGCSDPSACNYDHLAGCDDGSCVYVDAVGNCGGDCWDDIDGDLICDDVDSCTDLEACNYDDSANEPCLFADNIFNCGDVCYDPVLVGPLTLEGNIVSGVLDASNEGAAMGQISLEVNNFTYGPYPTTVISQTPFSIVATEGVCNPTNLTLLWEHEFCYNALTTLYQGYAQLIGTTTPEGIDCSGDCLEGTDSNQDGICDFLQTGCGDPAACNFDFEALFGGPCDYPAWGFDCEGIYGAGYCGPGTVWDSDELQCVPVEDSCSSDVDGNGVVGINDLLQILVDYALVCP